MLKFNGIQCKSIQLKILKNQMKITEKTLKTSAVSKHTEKALSSACSSECWLICAVAARFYDCKLQNVVFHLRPPQRPHIKPNAGLYVKNQLKFTKHPAFLLKKALAVERIHQLSF